MLGFPRSPGRTAGRRLGLGLIGAVLTTASVLLLNCSDDAAGPHLAVPGVFAVAPSFASPAAGIVDVAQIRFLVVRAADSTVAKDTVVEVAAETDTVDVALTVLVNATNEQFTLYMQLVDAAGDTVFRGGPISVMPSTAGGPPPVADVPLRYTGVGADAAGVEIVAVPPSAILAGATALLEAVALDSAGEPIPSTPIEWRSLDSTIVSVTERDTGIVTALDRRGTARIVALLLTGQADTAGVTVTLPPSAIGAASGNGQSGAILTALPQPLIARVTASDGIGVPGVYVRFTVATGAGSLSVDSVLTDSTGRASTVWTLGPNVGSQTVQARTAALPGTAATFTASATSTGAGTVMVFAGDGQGALVGTAVATAPAVIVRDAQGNPVAGSSVTFGVSAGAGSVTGATQITNASGVATVGSWTLGPTAGTNQLTATADTLPPVVFTATGTGPNGAFTMVATGGTGQSATVGSTLPVAPQVTVQDTAGNPATGVTVTFGVASGGGSVTGGTPATDGNGVAAVGSWTLGPTAGAQTLQASVTGLPGVTFTATGLVGPPDTVVIVSGDGQSVQAGTALPQPLVVEVQDSVGNAIPGVGVTWFTLGGSLNPTASVTNAQGQTQTAWTLGTNAIDQTATAAVTGITPAVFGATAIFPNPTVLLSLASGSDRIVVGGSEALDISLTQPAPAGGLTVDITSGNPSVIAVQTPGSVTIPQNGTTAQIGLDALTGGVATIFGAAVGYDTGTVNITGSVQVLSLPATLNVPFGGTTSMPVQISAPAGTGGEVVTLVSDDPTAVSLVTPSVTIAEGQTTINVTVRGGAPGTANVTGTSTNFGAAVSVVSTTAKLDITSTSTTINESFGAEVPVRLTSAGVPIAAPSPGIPVTFTPADPGCAAAVSPVTIPTGLIDTVLVVAYGGSTATPCTTTIEATAASIEPDTINVTVNPPPGISQSARTVGTGLQRNTNATLLFANHGGVDVIVKSLNPGVLRIAPDPNTAGMDSIVVPLVNGFQNVSHYLQGVAGTADTGDATVRVEVRAPGFVPDTITHTLRPPGYQLSSLLTTSVTTFSNDDPFWIDFGVLNSARTGIQEFQNTRTGGGSLTATITSCAPAVGRLITTPDTGATVQVSIGENVGNSPASVATGGVAFEPLTAGTTTIQATVPGWIALTNASLAVPVTAPGINQTPRVVGTGLQRNNSASLEAPDHGGVDVIVKSLNPGMLLIAPDPNTAGTDSIVVPVANGFTNVSHYLQGVAGTADTGDATVQVEVRAPGFVADTVIYTLRPPGYQLTRLATGVTTFSNDDPFWIDFGVVNGARTGIQEFQSTRTGGGSLTATITSSTPAVGRLITTPDTGATVQVSIGENVGNSPSSVATGGAALEPLSAGTTTIQATVPGWIALSGASAAVTVTAPGISQSVRTIGAGLQRNTGASLLAPDHGGVDVIVKSLNPAVLLIAPDQNTAGTDSIVVPVADGFTTVSHYLQGVEGIADTGNATVQVEVRAPGFVPDTVTHTVRPIIYQLASLVSTITSLSNDDPFWAQIGVANAARTGIQEFQVIRTGGVPLTATFTSSVPGVALLTNTAGTSGVRTAQIQVGATLTPTSVAAGGVAFTPLTPGMTTISVDIPTAIAATGSSQGVTVTTPGITLTDRTVGAGLQRVSTASLDAPAPAGTNLIIKSSAPGIALVSPSVSTAGSDSIVVALATGVQSSSYYIQGVEGATGAVTFTASASGYTDGSAVKTIVQPAVELTSLNASTTVGAADDAFWARVGAPNGTNTAMSEFQAVRAGAPTPLPVTFATNDFAVGQLVTLGGAFDTVMIGILETLNNTPTSVSAGGVAFDGVAQGTAVISASIPGFIMLPNATISVVVSP